jgi:hypothetical protein
VIVKVCVKAANTANYRKSQYGFKELLGLIASSDLAHSAIQSQTKQSLYIRNQATDINIGTYIHLVSCGVRDKIKE